jgi:hypothetical protein
MAEKYIPSCVADLLDKPRRGAHSWSMIKASQAMDNITGCFGVHETCLAIRGHAAAPR